jgi:small subunit ribosomal protein S8e
MSISQFRSKRKATGSRYIKGRGKKHCECGNTPIKTKVGEKKSKVVRTRGGLNKEILLKSDKMNIVNTKTKKTVIATIKNVIDNPANRNYIRANILTKGTVVETDKGKAKITNRPGQEGTINGIAVE